MSVIITGNADPKEAQAYVDYLENKYNRKLDKLDIRIDGEYADLDYTFSHVPFERIRRITGYLVGTMDHWNDAKAAEEAAKPAPVPEDIALLREIRDALKKN